MRVLSAIYGMFGPKMAHLSAHWYEICRESKNHSNTFHIEPLPINSILRLPPYDSDYSLPPSSLYSPYLCSLSRSLSFPPYILPAYGAHVVSQTSVLERNFQPVRPLQLRRSPSHLITSHLRPNHILLHRYVTQYTTVPHITSHHNLQIRPPTYTKAEIHHIM